MERLIFKSLLLVVFCLTLSSCTAYAGDVVKIARSQLGQGEMGGDNRGPVVKKYTNGQEVSWCAGFVSWTLKKAGKETPYLLAARSYLKHGKRVTKPQPGDIIVLTRKGGGHVGIVESVSGNNIVTIEGNKGKYPAVVKRVNYTLGKIPQLIAFVRV